jgi:diguanylate cyclase (GGDEF)-like protein
LAEQHKAAQLKDLEEQVTRQSALISELEHSLEASRSVADMARQELLQADQTIQAYRQMEDLIRDERETADVTIKAHETITNWSDKVNLQTLEITRAQELSAELASREMHRKNEALLEILSLSQALSSILDGRKLLTRIVQVLAKTLGVERVCLLLLENQRLIPRAMAGMDRTAWESEEFELPRRIVTDVEQTKKSILMARQTLPAGDKQTEASLLCLPFLVNGELVGIIYADIISQSKSLHAQDLNLAEIFGAQAAISIRNARLYEQIKKQLITDSFSGLYNRTKLEIDLDLLPEQEEPPALVMLNIDNFSFINGAYGVEAGNHVLQHVVDNLKTARSMLEPGPILYRPGADEFIMLFPDGQASIKEIDNAIRTTFNLNPVVYQDVHINISFSSSLVQGEKKDILKKAAMALESARHLGRGRSSVYDPAMDKEEKYKNDLYWGTRVRQAIEADRIIPYFQGIRNNKTGRTEKYECLVRLEDNDQIITPGSFIEAARQTGYFSHLTVIMIDKCFTAFKDQDLDFSINFSTDDLAMGNFLDLIENRLVKTGIDPGRVTFEVLESSDRFGSERIMDFIARLKEMGFKIAVDDFGKEFSNFSRILAIEPHYLKIDGSFIREICSNENSYKITRAIAEFAHSMGISVVAEFVENQEIQDVVTDLGIEFSQGYLFHKPSPRFDS